MFIYLFTHTFIWLFTYFFLCPFIYSYWLLAIIFIRQWFHQFGYEAQLTHLRSICDFTRQYNKMNMWYFRIFFRRNFPNSFFNGFRFPVKDFISLGPRRLKLFTDSLSLYFHEHLQWSVHDRKLDIIFSSWRCTHVIFYQLYGLDWWDKPQKGSF